MTNEEKIPTSRDCAGALVPKASCTSPEPGDALQDLPPWKERVVGADSNFGFESMTSFLTTESLATTPFPHKDDDTVFLEEGQPYPDASSQNCGVRTCRHPNPMLLVVVGGLLVSLIGTILLVVSLGVSTEGSKAEVPNPVDSGTPEEYLMTVLGLPLEMSPDVAMGKSSSPQQRAFQWLVEDPSLLAYSVDRIQQRYSLATLFHATKGSLWTNSENWLSYDHHECTWAYSNGLGKPSTKPCSSDTEKYEHLHLSYFNLDGTLPDEVYALSSLKTLDLKGNGNLRGTISSQIAQLSSLEMVSFAYCNMMGTLPAELNELSALRILDLSASEESERKFHGAIPSNFARMTALEELSLKFHRFSGSLPSEIGTMGKLTSLSIQGNFLTSTIPTQFGQLSQLREFNLFWNQMGGTLPSELGLLQHLEHLHVHFNSFQGHIPSSLGAAIQLEQLVLAENNFSGSAPSELGLLTSLKVLYLSHNAALTGTLPSSFEKLSVQAFDVSETSIHGDIPQPLHNAQNDTPFHRYYYECNHTFPCSE